MKKKKETCKYCGEKMEPKTVRQEFCSPKCRVYWNRENASDEKLKKEIADDSEITEILEEINKMEPYQDVQKWVDKDLNEVPKDKEPTKGTNVTVSIKSEMQQQFEKLQQEFLNKRKKT